MSVVIKTPDEIEKMRVAGRLAAEHGCWRWTGGTSVAPALAELIESRMGALPPAVGDVIDVLAPYEQPAAHV